MVFPVLGDDHSAIDCELAGAQRQGLFDAGVECLPVALYAAAAKVALWELVDVNRGDVNAGILPLPAPTVAKREAVKKMLRV